ncbi:bifunctional Phenylalanyl-tRNA synthetase/Ferrodoxin-fold anticodon-binding domain superfamily/Ferrodoxin-fold anticodon-binding domain/Class II Aminoacyl-tRNA synthetase-Biotinyl protein ligase (BPL) and lipoyl protein ligase (LPL)/Aminoacyl-tRNA synthetase [Babesia duncani]|uniref:phenylalanine--tRNA ligase n=1 Tax=Babesia duncani TaxID=323732 RepID=A0AAD9UMT1_9APIC|nr:bifunctional Phenylalanyl-tRNA synthetase/Ferrodoxin-fold anticodon-binding domain superfamily/Ferrodoxin-fold anticodon-binding domain/Class II Aminoacyl-tRNA synthetase-Biotinyl protein ligase (BPL) and lipoyl protein ligase (LPL)/Aminoacyl-tRNA synthetase [Babesia duncani]
MDFGNPIGITTYLIKEFFARGILENGTCNRIIEHMYCCNDPVSVRDNFDELQVPLNHSSRSPRETFYLSQEYSDSYPNVIERYKDISRDGDGSVYSREFINSIDEQFGHSKVKVLPTHTTSRLPQMLQSGYTSAIYSGQVFRRDEIDSQHFPVFHQLDGFMLFTSEDLIAVAKRHGPFEDISSGIIAHLKSTLEDLIYFLFNLVDGKVEKPELRWDHETSFPFTDPSMELHVKHKDKWVEILGCGQLKRVIIDNGLDSSDSVVGGWAFGIGLERLAMVLCNIKDIRQFWETDERFLKQYAQCKFTRRLVTFKAYSKNPPVIRDISFFINPLDKVTRFNHEAFCELVKKVGAPLVESVDLIDCFDHETQGSSRCYRIIYRAMGANLTSGAVNEVHGAIEGALVDAFNIIVR